MRIIYDEDLIGRKKSGSFGSYYRLKQNNRGVKFLMNKRAALKEFERLQEAYARCKQLVPKPYYLVKRWSTHLVRDDIASYWSFDDCYKYRSGWEYGYVMEHFEGRHPSIRDDFNSPLLDGLFSQLKACGITHNDLHSGNVIKTKKGYRVIDFGSFGVRIKK